MAYYIEHNSKLYNISQIVMNGNITYKLDFIAGIYIQNQFYFNVYRRYNSPYDIVIEDVNGDLYYHKDYTVRQSLQAVLCISAEEVEHLYTLSAMSYKHNAPAPSTTQDISEMRWSDIQRNFYAVRVNFGGILNDYHGLFPTSAIVQEYVPSYDCCVTPNKGTTPEEPNAPMKEEYTKDELTAASALLSLKIPRIDDFSKSETDYPSLSMRWSDVASRKRRRPSYVEDDDSYMANYTILRNGTMIPKKF